MRQPLSILLVGMVTACATGPGYQRPRVAVGADWVEKGELGTVDRDWWMQFSDPLLTRLITMATAQSPDVRIAEARLAEARALRDAAAGGRLPHVEAKGSATRNALSENGQLPIGAIPGFSRQFNLFDVGFDASWEIDFWGRRARSVEGAQARAEAALEAKRDVMVTLAAEIARAYLDVRAGQAEQRASDEVADVQGMVARLASLRSGAGEVPRAEVERAAAAARDSAAAASEARSRVAAAAYRLAALVGVSPDQLVPELLEAGEIPSSPDRILVGVRSELLERRPDVRRAERELAAATADIGVAQAELFPRFTLFGSLGQQARNVGDLGSTGSTRFQLGPSFSWPIFARGTIRAQVRAADARAQAAAARYEKAVFGALADSESAINRFLHAREAAEATAIALEREQAAFALVEGRVAGGEDDQLALTRARLALIAAQRRYDATVAAKGLAAIALFKALGGGWG